MTGHITYPLASIPCMSAPLFDMCALSRTHLVQHGLEVGSGQVDGSGVAGRTRADDDHLGVLLRRLLAVSLGLADVDSTVRDGGHGVDVLLGLVGG